MIIGNDLAQLSWVDVHTPATGAVTIEAYSSTFQNWVRDAFAKSRWADGQALTQELVARLTRPSRDAEPVGEAVALALSTEELDQFADAFLSATGQYFRPKYIGEGKGLRRKVRKRGDTDAYDLSAAEGETGSDRLSRILSAWIQDRDDFETMIDERSGFSRRELSRQHELISGATRLLGEQRRIAAFADPFQAYREITGALRPLTALADSIRALSQPPAFGIIAQISAQQAQMREITRLASPVALDALKGLHLYPNLATELASRIGLAAETSRAATSLAHSLSTAGVAHSFGLTALIDQATFARSLSRQFDVRLPAAALAAMSALTASSALTDAVQQQSFFPPGFQMAAVLGLKNSVARGLVADVLHHYNEALPNAPAFAGALESTAIVDAGALDEAEAVSFLQRAAGALLALIRNERDVIARAGLMGVLTFIVAVIATYIGYEGLLVAKQSLAVSEESLRLSKDQQTNSDLAAIIRESQATRQAFEAEQRGNAKVHDRIRYVHDRTPLRIEPQARGPVLRLVYPDQLLRVVDEKGDWIEVEVFDYQTDKSTRGWMSRRRLRLQPLP